MTVYFLLFNGIFIIKKSFYVKKEKYSLARNRTLIVLKIHMALSVIKRRVD